MPDASAVFGKVESILVGMGVAQEKIQAAADLKKDLLLDSFSAVEIAFALEEEFSIKIADDEMMSVKTVGDLVAAVQRRVQG